MSAITQKQIDIIEKGPWFASRCEHLKQFLLANGKCISLNAHESLFLRGDPHDGIYVVLSGIMRISGVNSNGKEAVLSFIDASLWFGEVTLFDKGLRTHDVYAQTNAELYFVPQRSLEQLLGKHPEYWQEFGLLLAQKLRLMFSSMEDHALHSAEQKVCNRLLMLGEQTNFSVPLALSQQQLADMTYLTRQTINQILQKLVKLNAISLGYQCITVLDIRKLQALAS
ncbi:Crp/Fnr family transcriptional regulator [Pseudoalteromonas sp. S409]|nr:MULTISPECIES: Crp/Fnr family transcriptional regulator [unclassified Pseudoalteromonas]TMN82654.1 Crp/Fnr family transcriptional regulator [Pseudoalteromonas sp. S410]TMN92769.1 Crp/Fnr family transcriptional regulator [Pseudoalteromonas sp. S408]TMN97439.1 Crp/Fnr family transcriptional regulator [Pseudoalteromonas sp. S409]TMO01093.1 Crp/Fnr family transcriptional regulator [Pseudoalteromonas sp. S407]TMO11291.1 Crp/Fnr family transcriptional regulator [Pseudoalteromonas sp. S186]